MMSITRRNVAQASGSRFPGVRCCTFTSTSFGRIEGYPSRQKRAADWLRAKNIGALVVTSENAVLGLISGSKLSSLHASKCGHCCLGCNGRAEVVGDEVGVRVAGRLDFFFGNSARIWACGSPNSPTLT
jgi:hypothetical protein